MTAELAEGHIHPLGWPAGTLVAVTFNVAWEHWGSGRVVEGRADIPLVAQTWRDRGVPDVQFESWLAYADGPGMRRLTDVFARSGVRASGMFSGMAVERRPEVARAWVDSGNEIVGHGYDQEVRNFMLEPDEERRMITRCRGVVAEATGRQLEGWFSPGGQPSASTLGILAGEGFSFSMDFADDDVPSVRQTPFGPIVAIPHQYDLHDIRTYARFGHPAGVYLEVFKRKFDALHAEGLLGAPKLLMASVHAHLYGHPHGAGVLTECIDYARRFPGVWFATKSELAERAGAAV